MDPAKYRTMFVQESREHIQVMSEAVLKLIREPSTTLYDHLFREAHSIKGMAASMSFHPLKEVGHVLEDLFEEIRCGGVAVGHQTIRLLLAGLDVMETLINEFEHAGKAVSPYSEFIEAVRAVAPAAGSAERRAQIAERKKPNLELIVPERTPRNANVHQEPSLLFRIDLEIGSSAPLPGARALVAVKAIEELGRVTRLTPSIEEIAAGRFQSQLSCYLVTQHNSSEIYEELSALTDVARVVVTAVDPFTKKAPSGIPPAFKNPMRRTTVRVETKAVDALVEGISELMMLNAQLQESSLEIPEAPRFGKLVEQLYHRALQLRMLPFEALSGNFPRIVYDLAQQLHKKVQIIIEGADIQMDKSILDELADPMIHLLRNAVDHGIEAPEERLGGDKAEIGMIRVSVVKQGDRVIIRIEDDGRGLNLETIKRTAIEKGLISERIASAMNTQEILMQITRAGFSTSANVSDVSGRGVGLDAVRARIESLNGSLRIASEPGRFTRFELMVPFTLAVIPAVLVSADRQLMAIPLSRIDSFVRIKKEDLHLTQGRFLAFPQTGTLHVERLSHVLKGVESREFPDEMPAFVTEHQSRKIAWCVDELIDGRQRLLKPLGEPLNLISCYSGATLLGKGEIVPVLDIEELYRDIQN
ncbi:MAG TPA: chemotaxis protein CheA [Acidobacteriota bacterium]|nr:chemotaxis protein CheA [Acidobacteriota bacterium]